MKVENPDFGSRYTTFNVTVGESIPKNYSLSVCIIAFMQLFRTSTIFPQRVVSTSKWPLSKAQAVSLAKW